MSNNQPQDVGTPNRGRGNTAKPKVSGIDPRESTSDQSFYSARSSTSFYSVQSLRSVRSRSTSLELTPSQGSQQGWFYPTTKPKLMHIPEEEPKSKIPPMLKDLDQDLIGSDLDATEKRDSYVTEAEEYDRDEIERRNLVKRPKKHREVNDTGESSSLELVKVTVKKPTTSKSLRSHSLLHESLAVSPNLSQIRMSLLTSSSLVSSDNEKDKSKAEDNDEKQDDDEYRNIHKDETNEEEFEEKVLKASKLEQSERIANELEETERISSELKAFEHQREGRGVKIAENSTAYQMSDDDDSDFYIHDLRADTHWGRRTSVESKVSRMTTNLILGNAFIYMVMPPDGGYGWLIVLISFLCQLVVDGIIFSVGIVMPSMAEDFDVPPRSIVLVASIQIGPFTSAFINKYGFRPVALSGSLLAMCALLTATFSPNLTFMIVFYSLIGGPSLSMIWVSSQLIIGYYFERYRPIANGISCAGAGAGILMFSAMNSVIAPEYGWRYTSRVHICFLGLVFFMVWTYIEVKPTKIARIHEEESESDESYYQYPTKSYRYSMTRSVQESTRFMDRGIDQMLEDFDPIEEKPGFLRYWWQRCCPALARDGVKRVGASVEKRYVIRNDIMEKQDLFYTGGADYDDVKDQDAGNDMLEGRQIEFTDGNEERINYTINTMQANRDSIISSQTFEELKLAHRHPCLAYISPKNWLHPKIVRAFRMLFDLNMLKVMEFQILLLSAFLFPMGFNIPFVYSKIRAEIDSVNAALISPAIGLSNFVFRIISGVAAFKYKTFTTYICGGGIVFGGLFVLISAFYGANLIWFQYVYAVCYGVAPAFYSTLRAIIYVRTLGLDKLTNAFGLTAMAMGLGVFMGTTLAGILNDLTGSYSASFAFSGICLILAGMLKLLLPTFVLWKEKRKMKVRKIKDKSTTHNPPKVSFQ